MDEKKPTISHLPDAPGCYIFLDSAGDCLYVGKSKRVKSRVRSYFGKHTPPKVQKLAKLIAKIEYRAAANEIDALYHEHSLIKTYRPPFNSQMKKDPHPYYICIDWGRTKPGLFISDRPDRKVARYGSFGSTYDAKEALAIINQAWRTPICEKRHFDDGSKGARACLNLHIGRCLGPCQPGDTPGYRQSMLSAAAFMQGRNKQALQDIKREMKQASIDMDFEKAAALRDMLRELDILQRRFVYRVPFGGRRICVFIKGYHEPGFLLLYYRNGQLKHAERFESVGSLDSFIEVITGNSMTNLQELDKLYTSTATQEIRARKYYVDVTKTSKASLPQRLEKAMLRFTQKR